ncbi:MAG: TetR/AcrR family transcriptional regulator [Xanthobacteraceae bacterium]
MAMLSEPAEADTTEADTQERVLVVAERLFREIGYQKTTVADIAKLLRMSPANVYRFFSSKDAIRQGVACRLMGEVEAAARTIVAGHEPAVERLRHLLASVHRMNTERYVGDAKLHEMVASAMEEDWAVCKAHIECITMLIAEVIADGMAEGVFRLADVRIAALCTCTAMLRFFHPQMIAQTANKPGPTLDQMIDFTLAGLGYAIESGSANARRGS